MQNDSSAARPNAIDSTTAASIADQALGTRDSARRDTDYGWDGKASAKEPGRTKVDTTSWMEDLKAQVRDNPLTSVGIAAALGYFWGVTR